MPLPTTYIPGMEPTPEETLTAKKRTVLKGRAYMCEHCKTVDYATVTWDDELRCFACSTCGRTDRERTKAVLGA